MSSPGKRPVADESGSYKRHKSAGAEKFSTHELAVDLKNWFEANGGWLNPDVQIVYSEECGFHVRALKKLSSPVVGTCPLKLTLSHLNLDHTQTAVPHVDSPLKACLGEIPNHVLTYLFLVEQRRFAACKEGKWHPYIACLPEPAAMTTPLWFDDDDMAYLAGTNVARAAIDRTQQLQDEWVHALAVLQRKGITVPSEADYKHFQWAATICTSRAFVSTHIVPDRETSSVLFPVLDLLNHSPHAKVEWDFKPYQSFSLKLMDYGQVDEGEELFNNYAPKQNDELLLGYGFCVPNNPIEQFAIKLALPPSLKAAADQMGAFRTENVPFGMSASFLDGNPQNEHHFLRLKGHPFGRYDNHVPCFRGVPPYIVHFFFIQALLSLNIFLRELQNIERPDTRLTLRVLILIYQAISHRSASLPISSPTITPTNEKQRYALIYRDGQATIIHMIRQELKDIIDKLRASVTPKIGPAILSIKEVLVTFSKDYPNEFELFRKGSENHFNVEFPENWQDRTQDITYDSDDGEVLWTMFFLVSVAYSLKVPKKETLIHAWLQDLFVEHKLPQIVDDNLEQIEWMNEVLGDFLAFDLESDDVFEPVSIPENGPWLINGEKIEQIGIKLMAWAIEVAGTEVFRLPPDQGHFMYMRPWKSDRSDEEWLYEEGI